MCEERRVKNLRFSFLITDNETKRYRIIEINWEAHVEDVYFILFLGDFMVDISNRVSYKITKLIAL
jgi:hypothetical protein